MTSCVDLPQPDPQSPTAPSTSRPVPETGQSWRRIAEMNTVSGQYAKRLGCDTTENMVPQSQALPMNKAISESFPVTRGRRDRLIRRRRSNSKASRLVILGDGRNKAPSCFAHETTLRLFYRLTLLTYIRVLLRNSLPLTYC